MTLTRGLIRNAATTPLDARLADAAIVVTNADGSPRTGVLNGSGAALVATTGTMNVTVAAAAFVTSKGTADGVAIFTNDGSVNVPIGAAPGSNSRIDVIWVKHNDNTTGDANSLPVFGVTAGVAAASPVASAIPTGALELATLRIYAGTVATNGGSNVLTNTYQMTVPRGAAVPFRTKADLDLWTNPAGAQEAFVTADLSTYRRIAGAWKLQERPWTNFTPSGVSGFAATFPIAKYKVSGGLVTVKIRASVSSMTANPSFNLPVNASDALVEHLQGGVALIPGAGSEAPGYVRKASASTVVIYCALVSGTNLYINNIAATVPIAWGATGTIAATFSYEVA